MENLLPLIISLVSGAAGGNLAGKILKKFSLGTLGNSIVGILGGGLGAQLLNMLGISTASGGTDIASIIGSLVSGAAGGGVLMTIVGFIKNAMSK